MKAKDLPIVWLLRKTFGDRSLYTLDTFDPQYQAMAEPGCFDGCTCEAYIPASRVTNRLENVESLLRAADVDSQLRSQLCLLRDELKLLIADVKA